MGAESAWFFMAFGHLKPGVTPAQAIGDLNSIGSYLEKTYPKDDANMTFALARPSLAGDLLGPPVKGFVTGLMLLSGLILLAACANLGSLFARAPPTVRRKWHCGSRLDRAANAFCGRCLPKPCSFQWPEARWPAGQHSAVARAERVAADSQPPHPRAGESGRKCLPGRIAFVIS